MAIAIPSDFPRQLSSRSLLGRHLTPEVWLSLKGLQTSTGVTLHDCIRSGLAHHDSTIGLYAGDEESVERFGLLFAPVIEDLHGCRNASDASACGQAESGQALFNPDPQGAFIRSTRIRLSRNLTGLRLMPTITGDELLEVQRRVLGAVGHDLAGSYRPVQMLNASVAAPTTKRHIAFDGTDRFQLAAGICRNWPLGRGLYSNPAQTLQVWVNEEDHLRIISIQAGADVDAVYSCLQRTYEHIERALCFQQSERWGYLASCPSNLGTGLRASFHIHLPLSGNSPAFRNLCTKHRIAVRGPAGENGPCKGAIYDISNQRRLGLSSKQCIQELLIGVGAIIELEMRFPQ